MTRRFRLTEPQRGIYFGRQWQGNDQLYQVIGISRINGALDPDRFARTIAMLHHQQPALRLHMLEDDEGPWQILRDQVTPDHAFIDLGDLDQAATEQCFQDLVTEARAYRFDLKRDLLLRTRLLKLGPQRFAFLIHVDHLICDAWGVSVIYNEVSRLYACLSADPNHQEPERPAFFDYIDFEADYLSGKRCDDDRAYWHEKITALEPFPLERAFPQPKRGFAAKREERLLRQSAEIYAYCERHKTSVYNFFAALISLYLHKISDLDQLALGVSVLNRPRKAHKAVVGMFSTFIPLVSAPSASGNFPELIRQIEAVGKRDFRRQRYPIHRILSRLGLNEARLLPVQFNYQNSLYDATFAGCAHDPVWYFAEAEEHVLTFNINDFQEGGIRFSLDYSTDVFDDIDLIYERFDHLLDSLLADDHLALDAVTLLGERERGLLAHFSRGPALRDDPAPIIVDFVQTAARHAARPALVAGDTLWDYAQLHRAACGYATALRAAEVEPGDAVLVQLEPGPQAVAAMLGIWLCNAVYVPIAVDTPPQRYAAIHRQTRARCIIAAKHDNAAAGITPAVAAGLVGECTPAVVHREDRAYVLFTSGSTGEPKAVANHHGALADYVVAYSDRVNIGEQDRVAQQAALTFDTSLEEIVPTLLHGACLVFLDRADLRDATRLWQTLARDGVTLLSTTPGVVALLNENPPAATPLTRLISGGDALQPGHIANLRPHLQLFNSYGPTETTICATYADINADGCNLGRPLPGAVVQVVDADGRPVPIGVTGEIAIAGRGLSLGYPHHAEAQRRHFVTNPQARHPRERTMYRSGDLGRWDNHGRLHFAGRADRQISLRGYRIEPGDIEAALEQHPLIRAAAVTCAGNDSDRYLIGHLESDAAPDNDSLRHFLSAFLPGHMIPWRYTCYARLPRTNSGKIDLHRLDQVDLTAAPDQAPPQTATEQALAEVWRTVLDVDINNRFAHFFQAGGHSLKATRLARAVERKLGRVMPLTVVFEHPVLHAQAAWLDQHGQTPTLVFPPAPAANEAPLTHAQTRLFLLQQRRPQDTAYHLPLFLALHGPLDRERLEQSLQRVVARHPSLRTRFLTRAGTTIQIADPHPTFRLEGFAVNPEQLDEALAQTMFAPFDLSQSPLFRAALWTTAPDHAVLSLVFHHIIADAWSIDVLLGELAAFYNDEVPQPLTEPFPIARYALWQASAAAHAHYAEARAFLHQRFPQPPPPLELPTQAARRDGLRPAGAITFAIPAATTRAFDSWLAGHNATRFMGLHAALAILLHIYSNERDIVIATPSAAREHADLEHSIGFYANTLALSCSVDLDESAATLLTRLRDQDSAAFDHAAYPFDALIDDLQPPHHTGRNPLFDVMLVLLNTRDVYQNLSKVTAQRLQPPVRHAKCDWLFSFRQSDAALFLDLEYDAHLYREPRMRAVADLLLRLLTLLPHHGTAPLHRLALVSPANPTQVRRNYAKTSAYFEAMAANYPDQIAVETSLEQLSYRALHQRVCALAAMLVEQHRVQPGEIVAVACDAPAQRVVALLALLRVGAVFLPLDPDQPEQRNQFALNDAGARILIAERPPSWAEHIVCITPHQAATPRTRHKPYAAKPDHPAYLLYTSGSTGVPKAVLQTHGCLNHLIDWQLANLPGKRRVLQFAAFTFDVFLQETLFALCGGSTLILPDPTERRDIAATARLIERAQVNIAFLPYTALKQLGEGATPDWGRHMRHLITAGEALVMTDGLKNFLRTRPHLCLHNHYGPTESHVVTAHTLAGGLADYPTLPPIGHSIGAVAARVCNAYGQDLPAGARGELWLAGPCLAAGYWQRPELTAAVFVSDGGRRWYRTGDQVSRDERGLFAFHGRTDQQVKINGYRVECGEVEHQLQQLPGVKQAVVVKTEQTGDLVAWLVCTAEPDPVSWRNRLRQLLPAWMVPQRFNTLATLPTTTSGKVDRRALAQRCATPAPSTSAGTAPHGETETLLAQLWTQLLPDAGADLDREADFFALGGNSISAARLALALGRDHGITLELALLFAHPRLCDLARRLDFLRRQGSFTPIPARPNPGQAPLSRAQLAMWHACQNPARARAYHIPAVFRLEGALDHNALTRAFNDLITRHEALRTYFRLVNGYPHQMIVAATPCAVPLRHCDDADHAQLAAQRFIEAEFDLENEFPLRAAVFALPAANEPPTYLAVFVIHHLVADGWSLDLLVNDWMTCLQARTLGQTPAARTPQRTYADFAAWEHSREVAPVQAEAATPPPLFAQPAPSQDPFTGRTDVFAWDTSLCDAMNQAARHRDTTLYAVCAATLAAALHCWTGHEHLLLGVPTAARYHADTRHMIGAFVTTLALPVTCHAATSFDELLQQVRRDLIALLDQAAPTPSAGAVQVALVLQNTAGNDSDRFLFPGMTVTPVDLFPRTNRLELSFNLREHAQGISMQVEYDTRLFDADDIALLVARWQTLTHTALTEPHGRIADLPFRAAAETQQAVLLDADFDF